MLQGLEDFLLCTVKSGELLIQTLLNKKGTRPLTEGATGWASLPMLGHQLGPERVCAAAADIPPVAKVQFVCL
jgi:hypothetical protein